MTKFSVLSLGWQLQLVGSVAIAGTLLIAAEESLAQIVPDNTLGAENSVVTPNLTINGVPSDRINGGATRGANLFHSFAQFNIGTGRGAYFFNPPGIQNILTRVTGANRSDILGRLGVLNGSANLFLINPNGIVFGPAASLDVQGSFLATTANAVKLGDTGLFSASQPATSNLLSVSPSALWFNAVAAQPIVNRSRAPSLIGQPNLVGLDPGLQVPDGRTLALVGGDVRLEGGRLTAAQGRIELGSVAGIGDVRLTQNGNRFTLGYDSINNFGTISLSNQAFIDTSGTGGGDIQVRGARLDMTQSSRIRSNTLGAQNGRGILVRTTETSLSEESSLRSDVTDTGTGAGGDLRIDTERLLVRDGGRVSATAFGAGKGGNLLINAADSIEVTGTTANGQSGSGLSAVAESRGSGDAGDLTINTRRLIVRDGGRVSTTTFYAGKGGNLLINAADSVEVIGTAANGRFPSGLYAQNARAAASGDAGDLTINTGRLLVRDGAQVSAGTFGSGRGGGLLVNASDSVEVIGIAANGRFPSGLFTESVGNGDAEELRINTRRLLVQGGAQVSSAAVRDGKGGSLLINAADSVEVIGTSTDGKWVSGLFSESLGSGNAGDLRIDTRRLLVRDGALVFAGTEGQGKGGSLLVRATDSVGLIGESSANGQRPSGLYTESLGSGNAGDLRIIDTGSLLVRDGVVISSRSFREGIAGNIDITVRDTLSANNGTIATSSNQSSGGGITITASNIRLFGNSDITSRVNEGAGGGGNIYLKAGSILAFGDSDILAFSRDGSGGNITLDTRAFFGQNYRPAPRGTDPRTLDGNNRVDINATGTVASGTITLPDTTLIQNSLTELPENRIDTNALLATSCIVRRNQPTQGSFTITGAGGLPQRPGDVQMSSFPTVDVETLPSDSTPSTTNPDRPWQKGDPIVEPQGVYRLSNGKLVISRECPYSDSQISKP